MHRSGSLEQLPNYPDSSLEPSRTEARDNRWLRATWFFSLVSLFLILLTLSARGAVEIEKKHWVVQSFHPGFSGPTETWEQSLLFLGRPVREFGSVEEADAYAAWFNNLTVTVLVGAG